ncbi:predicted protein [Sclerotinia sclerotiorum 1980 UF-70]|uniref:Uncharacterized protein n=1 Tax=Sclerotinia sclerotiorum (strain ATCC 18683 / 1980 / Ss-1) TaxID=665079 RepID=A7E7T5_SCLS1|nr:predicted protein [Sclerotinia sclerotiorum 1980 UF-70]EDN96437.1 predicted protein [Sclerotinia sclerotiorum 1980 UF-70]
MTSISRLRCNKAKSHCPDFFRSRAVHASLKPETDSRKFHEHGVTTGLARRSQKTFEYNDE